MTQSLRTDLNDFLFTTVANDVNGLHLTMLSALARSGVDPWDEAARLAALPRESATQTVVEMLAGVPNGPSPGDQTTTMAAILVAQLHSSSNPKIKPITSNDAAARGDELPLSSFSMLPAPVRWTIYGLGALFLVSIVYRTLMSS